MELQRRCAFVRSGVANRLDRLTRGCSARFRLLVLFAAIVRVLLAWPSCRPDWSKRRRPVYAPASHDAGRFVLRRVFPGIRVIPVRRCHAARRRCAVAFACHRTARRAASTCRSSSISLPSPLPLDFGSTILEWPVCCSSAIFFSCAGTTTAGEVCCHPRYQLRGAISASSETWTLFAAAAAGFVGITRLHRAWLHHTSMLGPGAARRHWWLSLALAIVWTIVRRRSKFRRSG